MTRLHLTDDDYAPEDIAAAVSTMQDTVAEWQRLIDQHTQNGQWASGSATPLALLAAADELITGISRSAVAARRELRLIDGRARQRFLTRTQSSSALRLEGKGSTLG